MTDNEKTLRCPLCGGMIFEHVDFHMNFGLDGNLNKLMGERCSSCGHVLLFLNM
jgi:DNA-directed RNA polymerase subunit RPC12/RpoP